MKIAVEQAGQDEVGFYLRLLKTGMLSLIARQQEARHRIVVTTHTYTGSISQIAVFALLALAVLLGAVSIIWLTRK